VVFIWDWGPVPIVVRSTALDDDSITATVMQGQALLHQRPRVGTFGVHSAATSKEPVDSCDSLKMLGDGCKSSCSRILTFSPTRGVLF
jgi:hypothetical protein